MVADGDVHSPADGRDVIILPRNVRFGTGGGSIVVDMVLIIVVDFVRHALVSLLPAVFEWHWCDEFRRILIAEADGGANMNLFVIGSAVFLINSMIVAFDGMAKLPVFGVDLVVKRISSLAVTELYSIYL